MKAKLRAVPGVVWGALKSAEARPAEVRLLRLVAAAVLAQAGVDVAHLFGA